MNKNIDTISNKIFNYLNNKYPNLKIYNLNLNSIKETVSKTKIQTKDDVTTLIKSIEKQIQNSNIKKTDTLDYTNDKTIQISYDNKLKNNNNYNILTPSNDKIYKEDISNKYKPFSESFPLKEREEVAKMVMPETIEKVYHIVIDSKDRNTTDNEKPNNYTIFLSPSNDKVSGYINKKFLNIKSVELVDCIIKDTSSYTSASNNGSDIPYILLQISELGSQFEGTNTYINNSFAILRDYSTLNNYFYYNLVGINGSKNIIKTFNPNISLTRLTIKFLKPDGEIFNFGNEADALTTTVNKLTFKITTVQKNLSTQFIDKA